MDDFKLIETILYKNAKSEVVGDFLIGDESIWASQKVVAEIFGTTSSNISMHFKNIIESGELIEDEVTIKSSDLFINNSDLDKPANNRGRPTKLYNLDAILSIGYRINSEKAIKFRKWANKILKQYMIKGFVLDKELLKRGGRFTKDYFDELLEEIREIRASERRFNQKITDIYATSFDYDPDAKITKAFFSTVQNKLIFAVSGHTAVEIIKLRSDSNKPFMGLTTWENVPDGKILSSDVVISKNYLNQEELTKLNTLVDGFLTIAESNANNQIPMAMEDWKELLDSYIKLNRLPLLSHKGKVSSKEAKNKAMVEYEKFRKIQDKEIDSDFDKMIDDTKKSYTLN